MASVFDLRKSKKTEQSSDSRVLSAFLGRLVKARKLHGSDGVPDIQEFDSRLRIQKYVYIAARHFGLDVDYRHVLHKYGPYSFQLARDYYASLKPSGPDDSFLLEGFKEAEFLQYIKGMNDKDLEITSTFMHTLKMHTSQKDHMESVKKIKSRHDVGHIERIYNDKFLPLEEHGAYF